MGKRLDLIGQRFGYLTVIEYVGNNKHGSSLWRCYCSYCGGEKVICASYLKSGKMKSCGCKHREVEDLTGRQFGDLTVVERDMNNDKTGAYWICLCSCGNVTTVNTGNLKHGNIKSCGCKQHKIEDLTGKRFGYLTVLEYMGNDKHGKSLWKCRCSNCGGEKVVCAGSLKSGLTQSCGCVKSKGELDVRNILSTLGIEYETEVSFDDLITQNGGKPRFDFMLCGGTGERFLLEYQGEQHYVGYDTDLQFGKFQRELTDGLKKDYCKEHGIRLYEIRYDEDTETRLLEILDECGIEYDISKLKAAS